MGRIAFTVAHQLPFTYSPNARLEFLTVITNSGGAYDPELHEFQCPLNGLYYFTVSSAAFPNTGTAMDIVMDELSLVHIHAANSPTPASSNSVIVYCQSGGRVYVQCSRSACTPMGTNDDWGNTVTFSGFLLY